MSYWYYNNPTIAKLDPNYGPESGGTQTTLVVGAASVPLRRLFACAIRKSDVRIPSRTMTLE